MSRAYRIKVRETLNRVIRAEDHVSTQLELLEILPSGEMAELLASELMRRGFERRDKVLVRKGDGISITVDPASGSVVVKSQVEEQLHLDSVKEGTVYDEVGPKKASHQREKLSNALRKELEDEARNRASNLQKQVTDRLEAQLADLHGELGQAINRTTAEALKRKAAQIGRIKEMTEDPETGSLSIVLEV